MCDTSEKELKGELDCNVKVNNDIKFNINMLNINGVEWAAIPEFKNAYVYTDCGDYHSVIIYKNRIQMVRWNASGRLKLLLTDDLSCYKKVFDEIDPIPEDPPYSLERSLDGFYYFYKERDEESAYCKYFERFKKNRNFDKWDWYDYGED